MPSVEQNMVYILVVIGWIFNEYIEKWMHRKKWTSIMIKAYTYT